MKKVITNSSFWNVYTPGMSVGVDLDTILGQGGLADIIGPNPYSVSCHAFMEKASSLYGEDKFRWDVIGSIANAAVAKVADEDTACGIYRHAAFSLLHPKRLAKSILTDGDDIVYLYFLQSPYVWTASAIIDGLSPGRAIANWFNLVLAANNIQEEMPDNVVVLRAEDVWKASEDIDLAYLKLGIPSTVSGSVEESRKDMWELVSDLDITTIIKVSSALAARQDLLKVAGYSILEV